MMDHERASELLGPLLRGELDAVTATELEGHLAGCEDCASEHRGLAALLSPVPGDGLNDLERARLHASLAEAVAGTTLIGAMPTVAKWLGVAATVILLGFGITQLNLSESNDESAGGADTAGSLEKAAPEAPLERGGPDIASDGGTSSESAASGVAPEALSDAQSKDLADDSTAPQQLVPALFDDDAGTFRGRDLKTFAARRAPFTEFAAAYSPADAAPLSASYVDALEGAVSKASDKATIRTCAELVLEQDFPILPAYGGYGRFDGRNVLVLGFVFAPGDGKLNNYLVWVWPRDDCDTPVKVLRGRIVR